MVTFKELAEKLRELSKLRKPDCLVIHPYIWNNEERRRAWLMMMWYAENNIKFPL